jgi:hypothetical protein
MTIKMAQKGMTAPQKRAIDDHLVELQEGVDADSLINYIYARRGFNSDQQEVLQSHAASGIRAREFFKAIKKVGNGWKLLEEGLKKAKQEWLWEHLFKWEQTARLQIAQEELAEEAQVRWIS